MSTNQFSCQVEPDATYKGRGTVTGDHILKLGCTSNSFKTSKLANKSDRVKQTLQVKRRVAGLFSGALLAAALHASPAYADENDAVTVWN